MKTKIFSLALLVAVVSVFSLASAQITCPDCDPRFVNTTGPDSVSATTGTAFLGKVSGSTTGWLYGVKGYAANTSSGEAYGGYFWTSSSGTGTKYALMARGYASSSGTSVGLYGFSSGLNAYAGKFETMLGTGNQYGVYTEGYSSGSGTAYGCYGYAYNMNGSGRTYGGYFYAPSSGTGIHYGVYGVEAAGGSGAAVYAAGDFVASGTKSAVLKTSRGHRLMSVMESPEVWFEDFGEGQFVGGKAHIELDQLFLETVTIDNPHPMKVFIQLTSGEPMNVVVNKGSTGFDVVASANMNATFDYRVVAKRKGYETERMTETEVGKDDPNLYPELLREIDKKHEEDRTKMQQMENERQYEKE